jgi:hypothetical protein
MDTNHSNRQSDFAAILDHVKSCENKAQSLAWQIYNSDIPITTKKKT